MNTENQWYTIEIQFLTPVELIEEHGGTVRVMVMPMLGNDLPFNYDDFIAIIDSDGERYIYPKSNLAWVWITPEDTEATEEQTE